MLFGNAAPISKFLFTFLNKRSEVIQHDSVSTHLYTFGRDPNSLSQFLVIITNQMWPPSERLFQLQHFVPGKGRALSLLLRWLLVICRYLIELAVTIAAGTCYVRIRSQEWAGSSEAGTRTCAVGVRRQWWAGVTVAFYKKNNKTLTY